MANGHGWVRVELRHFLALDAVASEGSFHGAATRLGYTQSAISQQIAALERSVGHNLVERPGGSRPVHLTRLEFLGCGTGALLPGIFRRRDERTCCEDREQPDDLRFGEPVHRRSVRGGCGRSQARSPLLE